MAQELEKARPLLATEGRRQENNMVRESWEKALKKSTVIPHDIWLIIQILEAKIQGGEIDIEEYLGTLRNAIARDKKLIPFYQGKGDKDREAFAAEKLKLEEGELQEIEQGMAEAG